MIDNIELNRFKGQFVFVDSLMSSEHDGLILLEHVTVWNYSSSTRREEVVLKHLRVGRETYTEGINIGIVKSYGSGMPLTVEIYDKNNMPLAMHFQYIKQLQWEEDYKNYMRPQWERERTKLIRDSYDKMRELREATYYPEVPEEPVTPAPVQPVVQPVVQAKQRVQVPAPHPSEKSARRPSLRSFILEVIDIFNPNNKFDRD